MSSEISANRPPPLVDISAEYEHSCKVAINFVKQYYTMMHSDPSQLHRFYVSDSAFVHGGNESGKCVPALGQKQIQEKVDSLQFSNCHTSIKQIDSLPALGNGIVIQVTGELSTRGSSMRAFVQSFVLSQDGPKKYSIVADIFRYQEDGDSYDEDNEPTSAEAATGEDDVPGDENGGLECQDQDPPDADPPTDTPAVPAGSQLISAQPLSAVTTQIEPSAGDWGLDSYEASEPVYNGPAAGSSEFTGESFPVESADTEDTQPLSHQQHTQDDPSSGFPESADQPSHQERGPVESAEREREQGDTGGHGTGGSYAFVSSIHTPQTGAKIAEQKFQTRTVYQPKKKPVSSGVLPRSVRDNRPPGPPQGTYRPKGGFETGGNRPPRESYQIFVGGIPKECTNDELRDCFSKHATVMDVRINPNGFGFVGFASEDQVGKIIDYGDRFFTIRGNFIRVERKGSSGGKAAGVKKRDGQQRSGPLPRY